MTGKRQLSDPYFLDSDSRVDSQHSDTPDRGQDASGRLTTGRPRVRSTQRHFTCFRELQKQVTKAERTEQRQLCDAQAYRDLVAQITSMRRLASSRLSPELQRTRL